MVSYLTHFIKKNSTYNMKMKEVFYIFILLEVLNLFYFSSPPQLTDHIAGAC